MRIGSKIMVTAATSAAAIALSALPALADSPHFNSASATLDKSGALVCSFKEAGLGTTVSTDHVSCSANATAVYECVNGGGNNPSAGNKETVSGPVSGAGDFPVRNGSATGSITVQPPGPGNFKCPGGQKLVLKSVTYSGITLTGSGGETATVPGTLTFTNPSAP
jgi:hypothetical protein